MTLAVFFPSLMGVGILVSGALLISDSIRRLFPQGSLRRKHNVVVGTYGAVADAVDAAGYHLAEPWFLGRGLRPQSLSSRNVFGPARDQRKRINAPLYAFVGRELRRRQRKL